MAAGEGWVAASSAWVVGVAATLTPALSLKGEGERGAADGVEPREARAGIGGGEVGAVSGRIFLAGEVKKGDARGRPDGGIPEVRAPGRQGSRGGRLRWDRSGRWVPAEDAGMTLRRAGAGANGRVGSRSLWRRSRSGKRSRGSQAGSMWTVGCRGLLR